MSGNNNKYLAVFDYDHTVVDKNTDSVARDLIPESLIPESVKNLYKSSGWIEYMQEVFNLLHVNNISQDHIKKAIRDIPETPGMTKCLQQLRQNKFEVIVISDSNSVFIEHWNKDRIGEYISEVFTNPARFDSDGKLCLAGYMYQTLCSLSSENLCKGQIMEDFIERRRGEGVTFDSVFYVGDGRNDICPMLRLGNNDYACPRVGYACEREIEHIARKFGKDINSEIYRWNNGEDLLEFMLQTVGGNSSSER